MITFFRPAVSRGFSWFLFLFAAFFAINGDYNFAMNRAPIFAVLPFGILLNAALVPWFLCLTGRIENKGAKVA